MQVSLMISTLLAGLTILLSLHAVDSLSASRRSEPQLFTLPLKRISQPDNNTHPVIRMQNRINRGALRLAMMTGDRSLQQRVKRRMLSLDGSSGIDKRFNRLGVSQNVGDVQLEKRFNRVGVFEPRRKRTGPSLAIEPAEAPTFPNSLGLAIESLDVGYLATLQIGTPPRNFTILVDSGSADFWVGAESCKKILDDDQVVRRQDVQGQNSTGGCGDHTFLGPEFSSSFTDLSKAFTVTYGTGKVTGGVISDTVVFAGLTLKHTFGVANQETPQFTDSDFDGLLGLANSKMSTQETPTLIEAFKMNGLVQFAIVSYILGRLNDTLNVGEITFGGVDYTKIQPSTLVNLPNISELGFWQCYLDAIGVDGRDLEILNRTAILDTGTTLMVIPYKDAKYIHMNIPGFVMFPPFVVPPNIFILLCDTIASVALTFGGKMFTINPRDLVREIVFTDPDGTRYCMSGIGSGSIDKSGTVWLVGDTFLKNAYFSTNFDNNTIILAKLAGEVF